MLHLALDLLLVFFLITASGVFVLVEFAFVSLRQSQIEQLESKGKRERKVALLAKDPNRFLSVTQIGVTFISFFSASLGAEVLSPYLESYLPNSVSLVLLTVIIALISLIIGEQVPKQLAIRQPEKIALVTGGALTFLAITLRPLVYILSKLSSLVLLLFGVKETDLSGDKISEEELQTIVESHDSLEDNEKQILTDVIGAGNCSITEVMRPRADVEFLEADMDLMEAAKHISDLPYSRFPVIGEDFDDVVGFVHVRDILDTHSWDKNAKTVRDVIRQILKFPGTNLLLPSLTQMRAKGVHIAVVLDEYGGTDGICTLEDMIEELIGEIHDEYDVKSRPKMIKANDGSFSLDAGISLEDFTDLTGIELPQGSYETIAGFVLSLLGHIASVGDAVEVNLSGDNDSIETEESNIITISVTRIDKMRITRVKVRQISSVESE